MSDTSAERLLRIRRQPGELIDATDSDGCEPVPRAATCPPALIDSDPEGHGLGIWVLVASDDKYCTYKYAGGIV